MVKILLEVLLKILLSLFITIIFFVLTGLIGLAFETYPILGTISIIGFFTTCVYILIFC